MSKKLTTADIKAKNAIKERDAAVSQLGVAYYTSEGLKAENEQLLEENTRLKSQLVQASSERDSESKQHAKKESMLNKKITRREEALREVTEMTQTIYELKNGTATVEYIRPRQKSNDRGSTRGLKKNSKAKRPQGDITMQNDAMLRLADSLAEQDIRDVTTNETITRGRKAAVPKTVALGRGKSRSKSRVRASKQKHQALVESDSEESGDDFTGRTFEGFSQARTEQQSTHGEASYSSFMAPGAMANLRKALDVAREAFHEREGADFEDGDTVRSSASNRGTVLPKKSALKSSKRPAPYEDDELTGRFNVSANQQDDDSEEDSVAEDTQNSKNTTIRSRASSTSKVSRRSRHTREEMTSAFIIPDITIANFPKEGSTTVLTPAAQRVLDNLAKHDGQNCTVCRRIVGHDGHNHAFEEAVTAPKPIPVSERMPEPDSYTEEPTLRPSQPPAEALAIVLKGLQDELAHLRMESAQVEAVYNRLDPSLAKRKRKAIGSRLEKLLKLMDTKADQIYALFDVLEGQKASGREMEQSEVEFTLNTLNLDLDAERNIQKTREAVEKANVYDIDGSEEEDSDGELPWEGIESTLDLTGRSARSAGSQRSKVASSKRRSWVY
jgi:Centrosome microtubule-binding domain of Cep57/Centrosome localisation domain of PPC89